MKGKMMCNEEVMNLGYGTMSPQMATARELQNSRRMLATLVLTQSIRSGLALAGREEQVRKGLQLAKELVE